MTSRESLPRLTRAIVSGADRLLPVIAVGSVVAAWAIFYRSTTFLPSPGEVIREAPSFLGDGETWTSLLVSLRRILLGLVAGVVIGILVSWLMGLDDRLRHVLAVYVSISLRIPSAIAAIMALVAFRRAEYGYPLVIAFITFPFVTVGVADGMASADQHLEAMARLYGYRPWRRFRHVLAPFAAPFIFSALRNAHALAWKVIVVVEIFGGAEHGIGAEFQFAYRNFNLVDLMLWLLLFVSVLLVIDYGALRSIERFVGRWRPPARA